MGLTFGSLFAGIGGIDLGLERSGMSCKWQVEIDDYANRVLAKHWPHVRRWSDVRTWPQPDTERVDLICGGFPCQDVSLAKHNAEGLAGQRSGLWFEFHRIIGLLRPRFVLVENVPGLLVRGFDSVLGGLAELGFDAEWSVVSACSVGAPHMRQRLFVLGYAKEVSPWNVNRQRASKRREQITGKRSCDEGTPWASEPCVARVAYGVPSGMDRLGATGNSVVPEVAELVGRRLIELVN